MHVCPNPKRLITALLITFALVVTTNAVTPRKRVLLVYQSDGYSSGPWELQQGILAHLQRAPGQGVEFFSEQIEATRFPESQTQSLAWIRTRYAARGINVVIFVGTTPKEILPGVPTIYAGHTSFKELKDGPNRDNTVTVWFKLDVNKTISAAHRLQMKAKNVLVIAGSGFEDHALLEEVRDQLKKSVLPVEYLVDATVDDLTFRVAHLSRDTIVLPISYTRDLKGNTYSTRDVVSLLSDVSTAPIYAAADTVLGSGAVGGYVVNFDKTGGIIADIALQTLNGESTTQISVPSDETASYLFDWRQLKKWGFSEKDLPDGSIVRFQTYSVWEQYYWRIIATIALIVAQFFLILRLLITQRKRAFAEAGLRDMTGCLMAAQDEERRRFARDLHDGTGQHLSAMALAIGQVLARFPPGHDSLRKLLQDSHSASRLALDEVRTVSFALHPPLLDGLGLVAAVRWYLNGLQKRTKLRVHFESPDRLNPLTPGAERALFRIVQESVGNVLHHSRGTSINVVLSNREKTVTLEIKDDGHGMTEDQLAQAKGTATLGVGIAGMRERLRQLHGDFKIQSSSTGTKVIATVPIEEERYAAHSIGR